MKILGYEIYRSDSSGANRNINLVMLSDAIENKELIDLGYKLTKLSNTITIYYRTKIIFLKDLTYISNYIIIAVVKQTAEIQ